MQGVNAQEICGSVRELLRTNSLSPGQNLPPIRHLAEELSVIATRLLRRIDGSLR